MTETFGQWKNESGGQIIVTKGKIPANPLVVETSTKNVDTTTEKFLVHLPSAIFTTTTESGETGAEIKSEETTSQSGELITEPLENIAKWPSSKITKIYAFFFFFRQFPIPLFFFYLLPRGTLGALFSSFTWYFPFYLIRRKHIFSFSLINYRRHGL